MDIKASWAYDDSSDSVTFSPFYADCMGAGINTASVPRVLTTNDKTAL